MQILLWLVIGFAMSGVVQWLFWQAMYRKDRLGWSGRLVVWLVLWLPFCLWVSWGIAMDITS